MRKIINILHTTFFMILIASCNNISDNINIRNEAEVANIRTQGEEIKLLELKSCCDCLDAKIKLNDLFKNLYETEREFLIKQFECLSDSDKQFIVYASENGLDRFLDINYFDLDYLHCNEQYKRYYHKYTYNTTERQKKLIDHYYYLQQKLDSTYIKYLDTKKFLSDKLHAITESLDKKFTWDEIKECPNYAKYKASEDRDNWSILYPSPYPKDKGEIEIIKASAGYNNLLKIMQEIPTNNVLESTPLKDIENKLQKTAISTKTQEGSNDAPEDIGVQAGNAADIEKPQIFTFAEIMPSYPGGEEKMYEFIQKNLEYPIKAKENKIEGRVMVQFVVLENGSIGEVKSVNKIKLGDGCEGAAMEVIKKMKSWNPGKQNGKAVQVWYTVPIQFSLQ